MSLDRDRLPVLSDDDRLRQTTLLAVVGVSALALAIWAAVRSAATSSTS